MARDTVSVEQIVNDFMLTADGDDYVNNVNGVVARNYALRGIREMGFDMMKRIKSLKLTVDTANDTVELPDDFEDIPNATSSSLILEVALNKLSKPPPVIPSPKPTRASGLSVAIPVIALNKFLSTCLLFLEEVR